MFIEGDTGHSARFQLSKSPRGNCVSGGGCEVFVYQVYAWGMQTPRVYAYGMCVLSTVHLLKGRFPEANAYQEIASSYQLAGGEAANAAILLSRWGVQSRFDGCFLGEGTEKVLSSYFGQRGVDISLLRSEPAFDGWKDLVLCDGETRTIFGWFGQNLFGGRRLWNEPDEASVAWADVVALDPFFGASSRKLAELCLAQRKPFVCIDCRHEELMACKAAALAISREFLQREYPGREESEVFEQYRGVCEGLLIFTRGAEGLLYSVGGGKPELMPSFAVEVVDSLAAGDTFRAGLVYGLAMRMSTLETLRFASAAAAVCCTRFPSIMDEPKLSEIEVLLRKG